jgi:hypothetical protein
MFIRRKEMGRYTFYQVVEGYREGKRVRHRTLASLGTSPTIPEAIKELDSLDRPLKRRLSILQTDQWPSPPIQREIARLQAKLSQHEERRAKLREVAKMLESMPNRCQNA